MSVFRPSWKQKGAVAQGSLMYQATRHRLCKDGGKQGQCDDEKLHVVVSSGKLLQETGQVYVVWFRMDELVIREERKSSWL